MRSKLGTRMHHMFILMGMIMSLCAASVRAQGPTIAYIQPDAAAPGMTVAVQVLAHADSIGAFGQDGIAPQELSIQFIDPSDTQRIVVGIPVVSWQGRMIQVPFFVQPNVSTGVPVAFRVRRGARVGNIELFHIVQPQSTIRIFGSVSLGDSALGRVLTPRNTLVVRGIEISGDAGNRGRVDIDTRDPDPAVPGNPRLLPVTILSQGPIRISNVDLHFEAMGKNGAPGGGGGGSGNEGTGGYGFTGGGSTGLASDSNVGSGSDAAVAFGGRGLTGVKGGASDQGDQGGGGGTGHPFGRSGEAGQPINNSALGGYGGGSAGGETQDTAYGGGGGAFAQNAIAGGGNGINAGIRTGGRLLLPLAGGSGGGAGNSVSDRLPAGSGGGGGGAVELVAFDSLLLSNTNFLAHGDSGTTGIAKTGGGGGGSGGGIVLASNTAMLTDHVTIDVRGGEGGEASAEGLRGGDGSVGMVRLDGFDSCRTCALPTHQQTAISQHRIAQQTLSTMVVEGFAGSTDAMSDSIRIYYRNTHTSWTRVDTVAFTRNGKRVWRKTIPSLNDSLLFVAAYQKVIAPRTALHDQDPQWISTHVSHQIVRTLSKPQILTSDTVRFPDTKVGRCIDSSIVIRNNGEAPLQINSIDVPQPFKSDRTALQIDGYSESLLTLLFCPTEVGCKDTTMTLHTNAGDRTIVLIGCGIETDERVHIDPKLLIFKDTKIGECDSATVTIRLLGPDETNIDLTSLFQPPFSIDTIGKKHTLRQGETETFMVRFCPSDSGLFRDTTKVVGPDSSFAVQGKGIRRILVKRDTVFDQDLCLNYSTIIEDTLLNRGNDTIIVDRVVTSSPQVRSLETLPPWRIAPGTQRAFRFELTPSTVGVASHTARYEFGNDSIAIAFFRWNANQRSVSIAVPDFYACAQQTDEQQLKITNGGSKVVSILVEGFNDKFKPVGAATFDLAPGDRALPIRFDPQVVGEFFDTISVIVSTEGCGDTTLSLVLHGSGTEKTLVFSRSSLDFGDVEIGQCAEDSIFITNVCGPTAIVDPEQLLPSQGFTTNLISRIELQTGDGIWVVYRFCPTSEGSFSAVHRMTAQDSTVHIELKGNGKLPAGSSKIYLSIEDALIAIGSIGATDLVIDSVSSGTALKSVTLSVGYDPRLLKLLKIEPLSRSITQVAVDSLLGMVRVAVEGAISDKLLRFTWMALLGPSARAVIALNDLATAPESQAIGTSGLVEIVDCFGLAGNVQIGELAVGMIKPQPVAETLDLLVQAPSNMSALLTINDASGRTVYSEPKELLRGLQRLPIRVAGLPAGAYWLVVESGGFVEIQRFWK